MCPVNIYSDQILLYIYLHIYIAIYICTCIYNVCVCVLKTLNDEYERGRDKNR